MAGMRVSLSDALKTFNDATTLNLRFEMPALTARAGPLFEPARLMRVGFFVSTVLATLHAQEKRMQSNRLVNRCCPSLSIAAFALAAFCSWSQPVLAQPAKTLEPASLSLQAEASTDVLQDTVVLVMAKEVEGVEPQALHGMLTGAIEPAFKQAKSQPGLSVKTGAFRVSPTYGSDGKMTGWKGRAELIIESKDFQAATKAVSQLSDRLVLSSVRFHLSQDLRKKEEAALIGQAAKAFRERASLAAQAFGYSQYRIEKLELGSSVNAPMPRAVMLRSPAPASTSRSDVVLEADTVPVSVQVSGTVVLH